MNMGEEAIGQDEANTEHLRGLLKQARQDTESWRPALQSAEKEVDYWKTKAQEAETRGNRLAKNIEKYNADLGKVLREAGFRDLPSWLEAYQEEDTHMRDFKTWVKERDKLRAFALFVSLWGCDGHPEEDVETCPTCEADKVLQELGHQPVPE